MPRPPAADEPGTMKHLLPTYVPPLSLMLADMGNPPPAAVAAALGVSRRTVARWQAADHAPRAALLALFWFTSWGSSAVAAEAHNRAMLYAGLAGALKSEVVELRHELGRVLALADTGAANAPSWRHLPVASVTPLAATA